MKELSPESIRKLETAVERVNNFNRQREALEGEAYKAEAVFRSRNRALIQAKKANSNYNCEVCGFNFEETYGAIGREYIIAHHLKPISSGATKTTLDDIALLCANCHAMVHTKDSPIPIKDLQKSLARH